jgi:hypothetical protein
MLAGAAPVDRIPAIIRFMLVEADAVPTNPNDRLALLTSVVAAVPKFEMALTMPVEAKMEPVTNPPALNRAAAPVLALLRAAPVPVAVMYDPARDANDIVSAADCDPKPTRVPAVAEATMLAVLVNDRLAKWMPDGNDPMAFDVRAFIAVGVVRNTVAGTLVVDAWMEPVMVPLVDRALATVGATVNAVNAELDRPTSP